MFINEKIIPVETFPGRMDGAIKVNGGGDEFKYI
jgi:hypothetical protein